MRTWTHGWRQTSRGLLPGIYQSTRLRIVLPDYKHLPPARRSVTQSLSNPGVGVWAGNYESGWEDSKIRLIRGSVLGPFLFLLSIRNLMQDIAGIHFLFAGGVGIAVGDIPQDLKAVGWWSIFLESINKSPEVWASDRKVDQVSRGSLRRVSGFRNLGVTVTRDFQASRHNS